MSGRGRVIRSRSRSPIAGPSSRRSPSPVPSSSSSSSSAQKPKPGESCSMPNYDSKLSNHFKDFMSITDLVLATQTEEACVAFCQKYNLIPRWINCPSCGERLEKIHYITEKNSTVFKKFFRCNKKSCNKKVSILKNTWFEGRRISLKKALHLTFLFTMKTSVKTAMENTSGESYGNFTSTETVVDTFSYIREVMYESLYTGKTFNKIGGPGHVVEIDEAKFGHRKYNRGRVVEGQWVLGGICRETKETFLVPVADRTEATLVSLILDHVAEGTIVHTDCFASYNHLDEVGYSHLTVNHSENFVDPESGCHTNTIESTWWAVKRCLKSSHTRKNLFHHHLAEYIWQKKHREDLSIFISLLNDIVKLYPGNTN